MVKLFNKNKFYSENEIIEIAAKNRMITVDCLKDENMISVEEEGADCLFEFSRIGEDKFKLTWSENDIKLMLKPK